MNAPMLSPTALDSNVLVAAVAAAHPCHASSAAILLSEPPNTFFVAGHSFAEMFVTLTRRGPSASFEWPADEAQNAVDAIAARTRLIGLTPEETVQAIGRYAGGGGIGARFYDHLIGETVIRAGAARLVTWNTRHFQSLFPQLEVLTPEEALT